jgi:hypothetical protein
MTAIEYQIVQEGAWLLDVICIAGSSDTLRAHSFNTALLQQAILSRRRLTA